MSDREYGEEHGKRPSAWEMRMTDHPSSETKGVFNDVGIRDLRATDIPRVLEIAVAAWTPIFASFRQILGEELFEAAFPNWQEDKKRQVRGACDSSSPAMVCVAEKEGMVVGFVTFYAKVSSGIGEIGNNAVHPEFQGRGIAPQMYQHAFDRLRERGMRFVKVGTGGDPSHAPARRAYAKAGFAIQLPGVEYYRKL